MMRENDVLAVLDLLAEADVPAWVDGGWGIDALLGRSTREHADVDLVVPLDRLPTVRDTLAAAGFTTVLRDWLPTALALADGTGRSVDLHPVVDTPGTGAEQILPDGSRFTYGSPGTGRIGGREVRCADAATQMRAHTGYEPTAKDRRDLALLHAHSGVALPPEYARSAGDPSAEVASADEQPVPPPA
ncbi:nucleotidyltransferase domain-containing protein [Streptomyces avicenniae]|uniref:nucleotidyltransferase domain-containing protein n=1 Tax=Streptomyces avicenniae TaxID=500153 RepID=UPI0006994E7D|nr:hypothetical protein [Streptomyces avicenniae]